ncbi:MAG: phage portal protein, partial [Thermoguttaceae bacterium]|nr:phage portal protein [Thermoguttaceae bacterium]
RGAPEIAPALRLFALLRRYTLAVVTAAEVAADFAAVITSDEIPGGTSAADEEGEAESLAWFEEVPITRGAMLKLPENNEVSQLKAEQPTTTYPDFKRELLSEIGRALQVPVNLVSGDSAKHNYASGRLDCQEFHKMIRLDQQAAGIAVMRPIFYAWFDEYAALERSQGRQTPKRPVVTFQWDGFEHVDPVKEADAQAIRLQSMTTTLADEYAKMGRDWEDALIQRKRELDKMRELGLTPEQVAPPSADRKTRKNDDEEGDDDE